MQSEVFIMLITQELLKTILDYNPESGVFVWKKVPSNKTQFLGKEAGGIGPAGYHRIKIDGKSYSTHRLVWLWFYGEWPKSVTDHRDGNKLNNHISNLRDVTPRGNNQNLKSHREGKLVGCRFHKRSNKWEARINEDGKYKFLGNFSTELEAHQAYMTACQRIQL
jgi:hypothetical protein